MRPQTRSGGAVVLVVSGLASAFALAACCAVPILLAGAGLSAYWLVPVATFGTQFAAILTGIAIVSLAGAAFIVLLSARTCAPGDLCARPWFRVTIVITAIVGAALLVTSKLYA